MKIKRVLIIGGCFDILHPGHIDFLKKARAKCDYLIVLLEPDEKVRMMKGMDRPKMNLESRILNLEKTGLVNDVIALPNLKTDVEYKKEIRRIISKFKYQISKNKEKVQIKENSNIRVYPLEIRKNPIFVFGLTKNDHNKIKNEKIRELGKKLGIEVIEVNELLPEWSTSKILTNTN